MTTVMHKKALLIELLDLNCYSLVPSKFSETSTQLDQNGFKNLVRSDLPIHTSSCIFTSILHGFEQLVSGIKPGRIRALVLESLQE